MVIKINLADLAGIDEESAVRTEKVGISLLDFMEVLVNLNRLVVSRYHCAGVTIRLVRGEVTDAVNRNG